MGLVKTGRVVKSELCGMEMELEEGSRLKKEKIILKENQFYKNPDIYTYAEYLAEKFSCDHIVEIGCEEIRQLKNFAHKFKIIGIDNRKNLKFCKQNYNFGEWIEHNFQKKNKIKIPPEILKRSIIICNNLINKVKNPNFLLETLRDILDHAPVLILTTPEEKVDDTNKDLLIKKDSYKKWTLKKFKDFLEDYQLNIGFIGLTIQNDFTLERNSIVALLQNNHSINFSKKSLFKPPKNFTVVAIMTVYNEADILLQSFSHLINQGIKVYVVDNWSTDGSYDLLKNFKNKNFIGFERYPPTGPPKFYNLKELLQRIEQISKEIPANWFIRNDVDEVRVSPWSEINLREAIYRVDKSGFNAIDHTILEFHPIDNGFKAGSNFVEYFKYYEFNQNSANFFQIKAWKNHNESVSLSESAGQEAKFKGRKVFPYKFLSKHYSIRSQKHGKKKIFSERKARYDPQAKALGWHSHYDFITKEHDFLYSVKNLEFFNENEFNTKFLIERLCGFGKILSKLKQELAKDSYILYLKNANNEKDSYILYLKNANNEKNSQIQSELTTIKSSLKNKESENAVLQSSLASAQQQILNFHQSFVFRMLHKYDNSIRKIIPLRPKKYLKSSL